MLDIKIKNTNESIDLGRASINFQTNNSLFSSKITQDYISYNFSIPPTPNNLKNLGLPQFIDSPDDFEDFDILIYILGSKEIEGVLTIEEVHDQYIKINISATNFDTRFLDLALSECNLGDDIDIGPDEADVIAHIETVNASGYPDVSHVFPMIYNPMFYNEQNPNWFKVVNYYYTASDVPVLVANENSSGIKNRNTLVPYFFLIWIFKQLFENNDVRLRGTFVDHLEAQKILIHNNFSLDAIENVYSLINAITTTDWYFLDTDTLICDDDSTPPMEDDDALYDNTTGEITLDTAGQLKIRLFNIKIKADYYIDTYYFIKIHLKINGVIVQTIQRAITWVYVTTLNETFTRTISAAEVTAGYKATIEFEFVRLQYAAGAFTPYPWKGTVYSGLNMVVEQSLDSELNVYNKTISPGNHLPKQSARDFVNAFVSGFKLMPYYDSVNKIFYLDFFEDVINSKDYVDVTKHQISSAISSKKNKGYTVSYNFDDDDFFSNQLTDLSNLTDLGTFDLVDDLPTPLSLGYVAFVSSVNAYYVTTDDSGTLIWERKKEAATNKVVVGDGSTTHQLDFAPFSMNAVDVDTVSGGIINFLLPQINEVGTSTLYGNGINEPLFKILIWHGLIAMPPSSLKYPFASSTNYDLNGNNLGDFSLKLNEEEDSMYVVFLKKYFDFLINTRLVKHKYTPDFSSFFSFNFNQKQLIFNQRFLTSSIKVKISQLGVESIDVDNYKV